MPNTFLHNEQIIDINSSPERPVVLYNPSEHMVQYWVYHRRRGAGPYHLFVPAREFLPKGHIEFTPDELESGEILVGVTCNEVGADSEAALLSVQW